MKASELKKEYATFQEKYKLPSFDTLNTLFEIDRIDSEHTLLRTIRKTAMDKVTEYLRLIEMLLNPINAPPMFGQFIKRVSHEDRVVLQGLYEKLTRLELLALELEIKYYEEREAGGIKLIAQTWESCVEQLGAAVRLMKRNFDEVPGIREKSYYG